jgi:hypothetical protein
MHATNELDVPLVRDVWVLAADDVNLGYAELSCLKRLLHHVVVGECVRAVLRFLCPAKRAETALDPADIGVVDVPVMVEEYFVAVDSLASDIRKPSDREQVGAFDERYSIVKR